MLAHAKINLGLYVVARRPDGFHDIETVFCGSASPMESVCTIRGDPRDILIAGSPSDDSNICHKAARIIRKHLNVPEGVHIHIEKHVPVGAGLGGGSADAATVVKELPAFWNRTLEAGDRLRIALELRIRCTLFPQ